LITAVDTSVLLDLFLRDPTYVAPSKNALRSSLSEGRVVACEVVWAEVSAFFPTVGDAQRAIQGLGVEFSPMQLEAALLASAVWKAYRTRGGQRRRIVADFLIGAHALTQADHLLTRDRGFYRYYFSDLSIVDPSV